MYEIGLIGPTGGTALIDGLDIRTDMEKIRQNVGLCPQHNLLFAKLTVAEHLKFFGMVKAQSGIVFGIRIFQTSIKFLSNYHHCR
jgi:ABC-type multidrug transport system ATPase subunit